jgi:hypothetical protein
MISGGGNGNNNSSSDDDDRSSRGGGGGGGGGRGLTTINASAVPLAIITWLEQSAAITHANSARTQGQALVSTRNAGMFGVRANAWSAFAGLGYNHSTVENNAVIARISINNPTLFTKDTMLSAWVKGTAVDRTTAFFGRWFSNQIRVIAFNQQADWEQPVQVAARVDLTGMNTANLVFYSYNQATNSFRRIAAPEYRIDANGFLHFTTPFAGSIVISDGVLVRK